MKKKLKTFFQHRFSLSDMSFEYFVDTNLFKSPAHQDNLIKTLLRPLQVQAGTYCLFNSFVVRTQPSQSYV